MSGCRSISICKRSPNRNLRPASPPPDRVLRRTGLRPMSQQRAASSPSTPETGICWRWRRSRPTNLRISSTASPLPNSASSRRRTTSRRSSTGRSRVRMRRVRRSSWSLRSLRCRRACSACEVFDGRPTSISTRAPTRTRTASRNRVRVSSAAPTPAGAVRSISRLRCGSRATPTSTRSRRGFLDPFERARRGRSSSRRGNPAVGGQLGFGSD